MKCIECNAVITNVLEQVEFGFGDEVIRIKNNPKTPVCQDCMYEAFEKTMDGILKN